MRQVIVTLTYKPVVGYTVKSTVNALALNPGDVLQRADVNALIRDGFTVKVVA